MHRCDTAGREIRRLESEDSDVLDKVRSGRPHKATTLESEARVGELTRTDRRITTNEMPAELMCVSDCTENHVVIPGIQQSLCQVRSKAAGAGRKTATEFVL